MTLTVKKKQTIKLWPTINIVKLITEPPQPPGNFNPFCGGVWISYGTAHCEKVLVEKKP